MVRTTSLFVAAVSALLVIALSSCASRQFAASPPAAEPDPAKTEVAALVQFIKAHGANEKDAQAETAKAYAALRDYMKKHDINDDFVTDHTIDCTVLRAEMLGQYAVIYANGVDSVTSGFVAFFDSITNKLVLLDTDFPVIGVGNTKTIHNQEATPQWLFVALMMSEGIGIPSYAVKVYTIDDSRPVLSLQKPNYKEVSGEDMLEAYDVTFEQCNDYIVRNGVYEIRTTGIATIKNGDKTTCRQLPDEVYVYDKRTKQFEQAHGRLTRYKVDLSSIYGDYGNLKGDWFEKPHSVGEEKEPPTDNVYDESKFVPEEWGEKP